MKVVKDFSMICDGCGRKTYVIYVDRDHNKLCPECHEKKEDKTDEDSGACKA